MGLLNFSITCQWALSVRGDRCYNLLGWKSKRDRDVVSVRNLFSLTSLAFPPVGPTDRSLSLSAPKANGGSSALPSGVDCEQKTVRREPDLPGQRLRSRAVVFRVRERPERAGHHRPRHGSQQGLR